MLIRNKPAPVGILALVMLVCVLAFSRASADEKRAKTTDGKEVILRDDGTWSYAPDSGGAKPDAPTYKGKRGTFALYLPPDAWKKQDRSNNKAAEVEFVHKDGDIFALVIAERIKIPLEILKKTVVGNLQAIDENAKVVFEEKRQVRGKEVLCMTMEATIQGFEAAYHGYYYSDDDGTIQVLTYTGRNMFKEAKPDMEGFLNGFDVVKK